MADQAPHDWQLLSRICNSLSRHDHPLYRALAHADYPKEYRLLALESALRSGEIPLCGCRVTAFGLANAERIETKIDAETAIDISLDEAALSNRYDCADLAASCRPHERPAKAIESAAPEWMPSDETRAEIATMTPRNGPPHFPAVGVIEFAVFQRVEADTAIVEQLLRSRNGEGRKSPFPKSRLPELERFLLDFDRKQEIAGESRSGDSAWAAAQDHFAEYVITRTMVRDARTAAGCLGKPGIKPIHAAK
jgi:hypothetical protein